MIFSGMSAVAVTNFSSNAPILRSPRLPQPDPGPASHGLPIISRYSKQWFKGERILIPPRVLSIITRMLSSSGLRGFGD